MALLIDTNIAIHLRDADDHFVTWAATRREDLSLSLVSVIELQAGLAASPSIAPNRERGYTNLLASVSIMQLDRATVDQYGRIVKACGFSRPKLLDHLIAATALVHDLTLVTINGADFRDIPDLRLEVWSASAQ